MAQNFLSCDREQELLFSPSLRDWLDQDHVAWFVLDAVETIDLAYVKLRRIHTADPALKRGSLRITGVLAQHASAVTEAVRLPSF